MAYGYNTENIKEVTTTKSVEVTNSLLKTGWRLLSVIGGFTFLLARYDATEAPFQHKI